MTTTITRLDQYGSREYTNTLSWLYAVAIGLHVPVDLYLTLSAWHLESNPLVLELGPQNWVLVKLVVFVVASLVFIDACRNTSRSYLIAAGTWFVLLIVLGVVLIVPNVLVLAGVLG